MKNAELKQQLPKNHPFENAELSNCYSYDDLPTYISSNDAYTFPIYDQSSNYILYWHHDVENCIAEEVTIELQELFDWDVTEGCKNAYRICKILNVPNEDLLTIKTQKAV